MQPVSRATSSAHSRPVGPNELRCIARQSLDLYRTLLVGGVYGTDRQDADVKSSLCKAIKYCISKHPILSAAILDENTQHPRFAKPAQLDIRNHLDIQLAQVDEVHDEVGLEKLIELWHDTALQDRATIPPWRVFVRPYGLSKSNDSSQSSHLILLGYYHSHGDGMAGIAFAKTLLEGLNLAERKMLLFDADPISKPCPEPFLLPFEKLAHLSISWSFLLGPLLGQYLPRFIANFFGFRPSPIPEAGDHWIGQRVIDPKGLKTGVKVMSVDADQVQKVLEACRSRGSRLTGLLHQVVVRALSEVIPVEAPAGCFVSQSAVDMRRMVDALSDMDMSLAVTGYYETFPRATEEFWAGWTTAGATHPVWKAVKKTTDGLYETANRLHNQPTGLLRYLTNMRGWTLGMIGKPREASYELSNLRAFDAPRGDDDAWSVKSMLFSQPANMAGGCFDVNVVSRKGGDMTIVLSWQIGDLAVADEKAFMGGVCRLIKRYIGELAGIPMAEG